ncbi:MAG: signal peptidase I, partial [Pasteurella sp.]|nr:signal peptidase I [Pasteurella sp.]
ISDIVLVNKYEKGLRLPVTNQRLTKGNAIERGDVIVFKYPNDPKISYIKRVIGLPGDKVFYDNRSLTINGKAVILKKLGEVNDSVEVKTYAGAEKRDLPFTILTEELPGKSHTIRYANNFKAPYVARQWVVPEGKYFVMGDNRDSSADGRAFGFLDDDLIIGKAGRIVLNVDCLMLKGKCNRFFKEIK